MKTLAQKHDALEFGLAGQKWAAQKLIGMGYRVKEMGLGCPFDLLVNDVKRIEAKIARPNERWEWFVNVHHGGKLNETNVDCYLFILTQIPGMKAMPLYLLFASPVERLTFKFSFASLLRKYHKAIDDWDVVGTPSRETTNYRIWKKNRLAQ